MLNGMSGTYVGILSFLSFGFSIIAALLATDLYRLLRTGEVGKSWRVLIITSVISVVLQGLHLVEYLNGQPPHGYPLTQVVELSFVMALAYAFYLQRSLFSSAAKERKRSHHEEEDIDTPLPDPTDGTIKNPRSKKWSTLTY